MTCWRCGDRSPTPLAGGTWSCVHCAAPLQHDPDAHTVADPYDLHNAHSLGEGCYVTVPVGGNNG